MREIHEYELEVEDEVVEIELTSSARIIDYFVGASNEPVIITLEFIGQPLVYKEFRWFVTGQELGPDPGIYVGSFVIPGDELHLFQQPGQYTDTHELETDQYFRGVEDEDDADTGRRTLGN